MKLSKLSAIFMACAAHAAFAQTQPTLPYDFKALDKTAPPAGIKALSLKEARVLHPGLGSAAQTCAESSLLSDFSKSKNESSFSVSQSKKSSTARANQELSKLKNWSELSNYAIAKLSEPLNQKKKSDTKMLANLYKYYRPVSDLQFASWSIPKRIELLKALEADPFLAAAEKNWKSLRIIKRIEIAQHVDAIHAKIYGYASPPVEGMYQTGTKKSGYDEALFNGEKILVNTYKNKKDPADHAVIYDSFAAYISVIVHEGDHVFFDLLAVEDNPPAELQIMAALARATFDDGHYLDANVAGYDAYILNPTEVNANAIEDDVLKYFQAKPEKRFEILSNLNQKKSTLDQTIGVLKKQIAAENPNQSCATFAPS